MTIGLISVTINYEIKDQKRGTIIMRPGKSVIFVLIISFVYISLAYGAEVKRYEATVNEDGVQVVNMIGDGYYFDPNYVVVKVNVPVEFRVKKESFIVPHDIVADSPDAGIVFKEKLSRDEKTIRFTPTKTGIFSFYCSKKPPFLKSHRDKGMEGVIEVIE